MKRYENRQLEHLLKSSDTSLVIAVRKYGFQSWKAWLLSLSVDLLSRGMIGNFYAHRKEGPMTALEADEYGRRAFLLLYYLLRGPFYQHFTK
jgi:peroxin-16